ncbi:hypothetical protein Trydic_g1455 [Trypoxylus dichotomus]
MHTVEWFVIDVQMLFIIICALFVLWYLCEYFKWRSKFLVPLEKLPGPKRYPILGTLYLFVNVPKDEIFYYYENFLKSMPPLFRSWNGSLPEINVRKPEHLELIMGNSIHNTKGKIYSYLLPWLGEGLLLSTGTKWQKHRKLITSAFHFKILETFLATFVEKCHLLLEQIEDKSEKGYFDISPNITYCTLDIICETAMGVTVNAMKNNSSDYIKSVYGICDLIVWRFLHPHIGDSLFRILPQGWQYEKYRKILHKFSHKVITDRKQIKEINNRRNTKLSFLDLLLEASENGSILSDEDIREEVDTFIFEGHDTITASLSWTILLLGNHPDAQHKAFLELQEVLGDKPIPTTTDELNRLKFLERVIKESLRLYPSVPGIARVIGQDISIDGYEIPKGTQALLHIYQVHRDPEQFPDPDMFEPDRFLPENCKNRHPYAYIPFSAGPRNCIGQKFAMCESKTILAGLIRRFEIEAKDNLNTIAPFGDVILRPMGGVIVQLKRRLDTIT